MEHVVFFPSPDGAPAFRRLASLDEAVRLVEHLRNVEGVSQVSCHTLTEVPLAFRAYYRVEVDGEPSAHSDQPAPEDQPVEVADLAPVADLPVQDPPYEQDQPQPQPEEQQPDHAQGERHLVVAQSASNSHAHGGAKSLGFFA